MSHRRPEDPRQAALENVLRNALRVAADSIEPAADGLERIRAKISARRRLQLPRWWTAIPIVILLSLLRRLEPAVIWARYAAGVVANRFRPDSERAGALGWLGWLRPAAAVATGLFVVAAASWAIAALPQEFSPATNSRGYTPNGAGGGSGGPQPSSASSGFTGPGVAGPSASSSPSASPTCKTTT